MYFSHVHITRSLRSAESSPEELLSMAWQLGCLSDATDPRDKAYGMFGLLKRLVGNGELPKVDYNKSVAQIFEETTRSVIRLSQSLWPLEIIAHHGGGKTASLPSWVPDLCDPSAISTEWRPGSVRFVVQDDLKKLKIPDASKSQTKLEARVREMHPERFSRKAELTLPDNDKFGRLSVKAYPLAEVREVYTRMPMSILGATDEDDVRIKCLSEWTAIASGLEEVQPADKTPPGGFLTAIQNLTPALGYLRERHSPNSEDDGGESKGERPPPQPKNVYDGAVLFGTSDGLLGLCKGEVSLGDKLWQLAGGRYPFILHRESTMQTMPLSSSVCSQDQVYTLVGIADVHSLDAGQGAARWHKEYVEDLFQDIVLI